MPVHAPPSLELDLQTQRPGELADLVTVIPEPELREQLRALAAASRLPLPLLVVIGVEAERVLDELTDDCAARRGELAAHLDHLARQSDAASFEPRSARSLRAYARALTSRSWRGRDDTPLTLVVPDRLHARWALAAQEAGKTLEAWIATRLESLEPGRERWEARAAAEGRTLAEWATLQALRRRRRSSTSAQDCAAG